MGSSMPPEKSGLTLVVQLQVGSKTLRLLVDTGAKELILFRSRLKGGRFWRPALKTAKIHHLSSVDKLRMVQLYQVRLGDTELGNLRAFLMEGRIQGYPELHGILGVACLDLARIQFDWDKRVIGWDW